MISKKDFVALGKGFVLLAGIGVAVWLAKVAGLTDMLDAHWIDVQVRGKGLWGAALYVGMTAVATGIGLPRQLMAFLGGYAFGIFTGTALATLGTALGCAGSFWVARLLGREFVSRKFGSKLAKVDGFLRFRPFMTALTIRLFPLGSNIATNLAAGVSSIPALPFIFGSMIGYLPQNAASALFGTGIEVSSTGKIALGAALFLASGVLGIMVYRAHRVRPGECRPGGSGPSQG